MKRQVIFAEKAKRDLRELHRYISENDDPRRADGYLDRIEVWCRSLDTFPERGEDLGDVRRGLRKAGFERRISILFAVKPRHVYVLRVVYGGQDIGRALKSLET